MKNIIILGANEGIGYWMAKKLLEDGHRVGVFDICTQGLDGLREQYKERLLVMSCDARSDESVEAAVDAFVERFGRIDIAVHNACRCTFESMEETSQEIYQEVLNVNYFGALRLTRSVAKHMKQTGGRIIFTSSGVGVMGFTKISPYASSKAAIETLAKCLNIEYKNSNISFHLFHPPLTNTTSASPLPIPKEFMAMPEKVGIGLAKHINKKSFIICHNLSQKLQTMWCYLFPVKMGKLMSRLTDAYEKDQQSAVLENKT